MDGFHLSRAQLSALPDPANAHARRGAAFTFDSAKFLALVQKLRLPLSLLPSSTSSSSSSGLLLLESSETKKNNIYAPSFDHAVKDPVENDIMIPTTARIIVFEGNYLSLGKGLWKEAASLMDELWFVTVEMDTARKRLVRRHLKAGIARDEEEALKRVEENDLVNGREILEFRLEDVQEVVVSKEDENWKEGSDLI